jgi:septal ring factor EnvC (AmiA/AmiB activator)
MTGSRAPARAAWARLATRWCLVPALLLAVAAPGASAQGHAGPGHAAQAPAARAPTKAVAVQKTAAAQKALAQTRAQIQAVADEQKRLERERGSAASALREADAQVAGTQRTLAELDADIAAKARDLEALQQRKLALENGLVRQRAELAALVRSAYALGDHQELKLLLEQDRIGDLARVLAYHRYFERDLQARIGSLDAQLAELAQVQSRIGREREALVAARAARKGELAQLDAQRRARGEMVATLDRKYRDRSARLQALGRDEQNTVALLERLRKLMASLPKPKPPRPASRPGAKPSSPGRVVAAPVRHANIPIGALNLPLAGSVLAGFRGTMPDGHPSQGLLIAGSAGAPVHAVKAGRVAYADWLKGYGLLMILDHGDGWMSLYAYNDTLLKAAGDAVQAGEAISTVGSSGGQGRPALYFELRRDGQPQDPTGWLRR